MERLNGPKTNDLEAANAAVVEVNKLFTDENLAEQYKEAAVQDQEGKNLVKSKLWGSNQFMTLASDKVVPNGHYHIYYDLQESTAKVEEISP